jgi:signal transduction histidine kinase
MIDRLKGWWNRFVVAKKLQCQTEHGDREKELKQQVSEQSHRLRNNTMALGSVLEDLAQALREEREWTKH